MLFEPNPRWATSKQYDCIRRVFAISTDENFLKFVMNNVGLRVSLATTQGYAMYPISDASLDEFSKRELEDFLEDHFHDLMRGDEDRCPSLFAAHELDKHITELHAKGYVSLSTPLYRLTEQKYGVQNGVPTNLDILFDEYRPNIKQPRPPSSPACLPVKGRVPRSKG